MANFGLIETLRIINTKIPFLDLHIDRLYRSLQKIGFIIEYNELKKQFSQVIKTVYKEQIPTNLRLRIEVVISEENKLLWHYNSLVLNNTQFTLNKEPLNISIFNEDLKENNALSNLKSTDRLIYDKAKSYTKKNNLDDALIFNKDNFLADAIIFNVFIVKDNQIFTPKITDAPIDGILRRFLLQTIKNFPIIEKSINQKELLKADEIFLTNAVRGIQQVGKINDIFLKNDITQKIFNEFVLKIPNYNHQIP